MTKINWKIRIKQPGFWIGIASAILTPILAVAGVDFSTLTTWNALGEVLMNVISNPFVLFTAVTTIVTTIQDPTTKGLGDSERALSYEEPSI